MTKLKAGALVCFVVFICVVVSSVFMTKEGEELPYNTKQIEVKSSVITGYKDAIVSWRVKANYIWAGKSKYLFRGEGVVDGQLYDSNGVPVVRKIRAERVRVNTKSKTVSAIGNVSAIFEKRLKESEASQTKEGSPSLIQIKAEELRYFSSTKKTYLSKKVEIKKGDAIIYPKQGIEIDNDQNVLLIRDGFVMMSDRFIVTGNTMAIYIDDDYSLMQGNIQAERKPEYPHSEGLDFRERDLKAQGAFLSCQSMRYSNENNNDIIWVSGNVTIKQKGRTIFAASGYYNKADRLFSMKDNVEIRMDELDWLINKKKKGFKNDDIQSTLGKPTTINASVVVFDASEKSVFLRGAVRITQSDKELTCQRVRYNDKAETLVFSKGVQVKKNNQDELHCHTLEVDLNKESFSAGKRVSTTFEIKN